MLTYEMLAFVQCCMMAATLRDMESPLYRRLEKIETYLIKRYNRGS